MIEGLDIAGIRGRFPALARQVDGVPVVYLDGPGGSQTPDSVAGAVADYLLSANANVGGPFVTSAATDELLLDAHLAAADFLGCTEEQVVFGANTTTINFLLAHALARTLNPGDEIIVTEIDHDANVSPWLLIAGDRDLTVHTAPLAPRDGTLDLDAVEALITARTRVVAFTLASNALGSIPDAARLANAAHSAGALVWVDGVHMAPHRRVDRVGARRRRAAHLGLQVFRPAPRGRRRPRRAGALIAGRPGTARAGGAGRPPLRDRHPVPRGACRLHRGDRVPRVTGI